MLVLLPLLWLLSVWARDSAPTKDSKYVIRSITSCPAVGYFFRRQTSPNALAPLCYLCFCQDDGTAVCWQRENRRCDARHYQHGVGKRDTRVRRSPLGISDIFFRDAARDIFNKQIKPTCKPFETSFSEGCPPDDWCTGCTVCDCDANGRWDCHVLSFCPDKNNNTKTKKTKVPVGATLPKRTTPRPAKTTKGKKKITKPVQKSARRTTKKPKIKRNPKEIRHAVRSKQNKNVQKNIASPKPLIKKRDTVSKRPILKKADHSQLQLNPDDTAKITQEVYKKVAAAVQKMIKNKISTQVQAMKNMQKRSLGNSTQPCGKKKNIKKLKNIRGPKKDNGNKSQAKKVKRENLKSIKKQVHKPTFPPKRTWRIKREIGSDVAEASNSISLITDTPLDVMTNVTITTIDNRTTISDSYFKYTVITPKPSNMTSDNKYPIIYVNVTDEDTLKINHLTNTMGDEERKLDKANKTTDQKSINGRKVHLMDIISDFNDLKFKKWSQLKLFENNRTLNKLMSLNKTLPIENSSNETHKNSPITPKSNLRDIIRLVTPAVRRYNKSKIVNTIHSKKRILKNVIHNYSFKERVFHKIDDLQNVLKKLLTELRKNNTIVAKAKPKRLNIIKYLKKLFRKVFKKRKNKIVAADNKTKFNHHLIDIICENFDDCNLTKVNKVVLNTKIKELYAESFVILRSINIIKGLLRLLDFPFNTTDNPSSNFKDDISKLNFILKDRYLTSNHVFTETDIAQINYIKKNTQSFIQAVGRFANKLNDVILLLTTKPSEVKKRHVVKDGRKNKSNEKLKNRKVGEEYLGKLKTMLDKYTLAQAELIQRMSQSIRKFEHLEDEKSKEQMINDNKNASRNILRYSDNIIKNLQKLKELAVKLSSRSRSKRNTFMRDDDAAMDYLLTLMEYLLKQNHPLDAAPVNDGIDLLIEAIKTAPDVKPIKKKVLQTIPVITGTLPTSQTLVNMSKEDSSSDSSSNRISKEDNDIGDTRRQKVYQQKDADQSSQTIIEEVQTESVYNNKNPVTTETSMSETTTAEETNEIKKPMETITEHNNFEKLEKAINESKTDTDKIEVYVVDVDEEEPNTDITTTTQAIEGAEESEATTIAPIETTEFKLAEIKARQNINSIDISDSHDGHKRVTLDWLDEGEEQDTREAKSIQNTTALATHDSSTKISITEKKEHSDNISSITKELHDEENRKKKTHINVEDVIFKKQMDLLNSLDYGTEKSDAEETESKDADERDTADAFPSYFI